MENKENVCESLNLSLGSALKENLRKIHRLETEKSGRLSSESYLNIDTRNQDCHDTSSFVIEVTLNAKQTVSKSTEKNSRILSCDNDKKKSGKGPETSSKAVEKKSFFVKSPGTNDKKTVKKKSVKSLGTNDKKTVEKKSVKSPETNDNRTAEKKSGISPVINVTVEIDECIQTTKTDEKGPIGLKDRDVHYNKEDSVGSEQEINSTFKIKEISESESAIFQKNSGVNESETEVSFNSTEQLSNAHNDFQESNSSEARSRSNSQLKSTSPRENCMGQDPQTVSGTINVDKTEVVVDLELSHVHGLGHTHTSHNVVDLPSQVLEQTSDSVDSLLSQKPNQIIVSDNSNSVSGEAPGHASISQQPVYNIVCTEDELVQELAVLTDCIPNWERGHLEFRDTSDSVGDVSGPGVESIQGISGQDLAHANSSVNVRPSVEEPNDISNGSSGIGSELVLSITDKEEKQSVSKRLETLARKSVPVTEATEDDCRESRQYHPYKKRKKRSRKSRKPKDSFDMAYSDMDELLEDLTTPFFKMVQKAPLFIPVCPYNIRRPGRFAGFKFQRTQIQQILPGDSITKVVVL